MRPTRNITFSLMGRPGEWATSRDGAVFRRAIRPAPDPPDVAGVDLEEHASDTAAMLRGERKPTPMELRRYADQLPHPQAFSALLVNRYPVRTGTCRGCQHLNVSCCARAYCRKASPISPATTVNVILDGRCPEGLFSETSPP